MTTRMRAIEQKVGIDAAGQEVSPFSSNAVKIVGNGKWTVEVTDYNGRVTVGCGRRPFASRKEAETWILQQFGGER